MKTYIRCGHHITITESWKTLLGEDNSISRRPFPLELKRKCRDKDEILKAVDDYFTEVD